MPYRIVIACAEELNDSQLYLPHGITNGKVSKEVKTKSGPGNKIREIIPDGGKCYMAGRICEIGGFKLGMKE